MKAQNLPLGEKDYLNPSEAIRYWNLSNRKFYEFLKKDQYDFIALYGTRKLIIRTAFDKYLKKNPRVKEALANGESNQAKKRLKAQSAAQR